jgi:putative thioredoxin
MRSRRRRGRAAPPEAIAEGGREVYLRAEEIGREDAMLGFGKNTKPAAGAETAVKDTTDASFMADVIQASREQPVVVDFWAPWCGPCKTLGPLLEQAVAATGGKVKMVKVNVDQNQMVAQQLRVQSIPTVYAFVDGQPVDGFMGAVSPAEVKEFVARLARDADADMVGAALDQAEALLEQGAAAEAAQTFAALLSQDPENARAMGGMIRATLAVGDVERAAQTLDAVPAKIADQPPIAAARAAVDLAMQTQDAGETRDLRARLERNPNDHEARFDLAIALLAKRDREGAVDELLELFRRDREWNEGAAKAQLMKVFDTLGPKDPIALKGRRRLSSMIFS